MVLFENGVQRPSIGVSWDIRSITRLALLTNKDKEFQMTYTVAAALRA